MDISDLEIFCAVVKADGISRAAERLHRVPSNVTTRIRQLEENLGVQLFLRERNRLKITPTGEVLLDYAARILDLANEAHDALQDKTPRGHLCLGTMESAAAARLPVPLAEYHKLFPQVKLELRTGSTRKLVAQVISGELETAIVADPMQDTRLAMAPLFKEELLIVAESGHAAISSPKDCIGKTLLAFGEGCAYRKRLEDWFTDSNTVSDHIVEIGSYHAMLGCVVAGMGIALLPRSVLEILSEHSLVSVHTLPHEWRLSITYMIWRKKMKSVRVNTLEQVLCVTDRL